MAKGRNCITSFDRI